MAYRRPAAAACGVEQRLMRPILRVLACAGPERGHSLNETLDYEDNDDRFPE